ncbi:MAG: EAL domain-containing protein [Bacilli bacterium]|jgi:EAL domain-containing protein (putative c-di-GMP-specific phosphodiesterase class I)|nr:EAL domain-containing protein [Bacilli bacterium]
MARKEDRRLVQEVNRSLLWVYVVLGTLAAALLAFIFLYIFLDRTVYFYVMMAIAILIAVLASVVLSSIPKKMADLISKGLTSEIMMTLNSLTVQKEPVYMARTGVIEFDDLKQRLADVINSMRDVMIVDRKIDDSYLKFGHETGYKDLISHDSFLYNLPFILKLNAYSRGGLLLVNILGNETPPKDAIQTLVDDIEKIFTTKVYIGLYSDDTLIVYVTDIESLSIFRSLCLRLYAAFSYLQTGLTVSSVLTCKIGAAVFPYSLKDSLVPDAQEALERSKDVEIFIPKAFTSVKDSLSIDDIRRKDILILDELIGYLYQYKTASSAKAELANKILPLAQSAGFETLGVLVRPEISGANDFFSCSLEIGSPTLRVFANRADISFEELKDLYEARDSSDSFYSTRREDLSPELARFFDKYRLQGLYCSFFGEGGNILGMTYFLTDKKIRPLVSVDSHVILMEMMVLNLIWMSSLTANSQKLVKDDLESVLKLDGRLRYILNPESYVLLGLSDGLIDLYGKEAIGKKCYELFFKGERPCADCPLTNGKLADNPVMIQGQKYLRRKLSFSTPDNSCSILLDPVIPGVKEKLPSRFDPQTFLSSRVAFNEEIDNLVLAKAKGSLVLISLEGVNKILTTYGEVNLSNILLEMKKRIEDLEIEEKAYRYDDGVVGIYFSETTRVQTYDLIEKIHEALKLPYDLEGSGVKCHFRYIEVNFNGAFSSTAEVFSLISKGMIQARKLPDDYMCISSEPISRMADKKDYVLYLMEENYLNKAVEFRIQPITSAKDGSIRYGEILLRLYDMLREKMLSPLEVVNIASDAKKMGKFDSLNYETAVGLYNKYGSGIFRLYSYGGVSINISADSLESNDWLSKLKKYIENNMVPERFLGLEIPEHDFTPEMGRIKIWLNELRSYHLSWAIDNYADEHISPRELSELGFDTAKFSRKFLLDAVADPVTKGLFESVIRECHYNHLTVVVQGVETKEQYEFAKKAGADYIQGFYLYEPLKIEEFVTAVQEHPDIQKIQQSRAEGKETANVPGAEAKKKPSFFERLKARSNTRKLLKAQKKAQRQQRMLETSAIIEGNDNSPSLTPSEEPNQGENKA